MAGCSECNHDTATSTYSIAGCGRLMGHACEEMMLGVCSRDHSDVDPLPTPLSSDKNDTEAEKHTRVPDDHPRLTA